MTTIRYQREHTRICDIDLSLLDKKIVFAGWLRSSVIGNKILTLYDGSDTTIQAINDKPELLEGVTVGSFIKFLAVVCKHPKRINVVELHIIEIISVSKISDPGHYPLSGKPTLQNLRNFQELRGHSQTIGAIRRITATCSYLITEFMNKQRVLQVFPPTLTGSDCEGAGETFTVTTLTTLPKKRDDYSHDFFGTHASLTVSAQLHLEALLRGLGDVWCLLPSYRAEPSDTSRHVASFTHQEAEFMNMSLEGLMDFMEELTKYIFSGVLAKNLADFELLRKFADKTELIPKLNKYSSKSYARITYTQAIDMIHSSEHKDKILAKCSGLVLPTWGDDLGSECEKYLSEYFDVPTFVHHYPASLKSFYMKQSTSEDIDDVKKMTVESCDLLMPQMGELCGASVREDNYDKLMKVITDRKMDVGPIQWYVDLRKDGSVPTAGYGMGFERLICSITDMHIRDVCQFIQAHKTLKY